MAGHESLVKLCREDCGGFMGIGDLDHRSDVNLFRLRNRGNSAGIAMAGMTKPLLAILLLTTTALSASA